MSISEPATSRHHVAHARYLHLKQLIRELRIAQQLRQSRQRIKETKEKIRISDESVDIAHALLLESQRLLSVLRQQFPTKH